MLKVKDSRIRFHLLTSWSRAGAVAISEYIPRCFTTAAGVNGRAILHRNKITINKNDALFESRWIKRAGRSNNLRERRARRDRRERVCVEGWGGERERGKDAVAVARSWYLIRWNDIIQVINDIGRKKKERKTFIVLFFAVCSKWCSDVGWDLCIHFRSEHRKSGQ